MLRSILLRSASAGVALRLSLSANCATSCLGDNLGGFFILGLGVTHW